MNLDPSLNSQREYFKKERIIFPVKIRHSLSLHISKSINFIKYQTELSVKKQNKNSSKIIRTETGYSVKCIELLSHQFLINFSIYKLSQLRL